MVKKIFSIVLVLSVVGMVLGGCNKDEAATDGGAAGTATDTKAPE
ncbi:MAG TPA: hypothetical protein VM328_05205 [Fimbriimonadaceae bacterium]|nr:hypothetical protein [Fimbriimonadaceae bacterium]